MAFSTNDGTHRSQYHHKVNLFKLRRNHRKTESKSVLAMKNIAIWIAYYRENPHRFVLDFLGINLRPFQCVLLWAMIHHHYFVFIASRGLGKTFLSGVYCVTRCVLYPETKIIITAPTKSQGINVLEKIENEMMSPLLAREIEDINTGNQKPMISFHNGSWIRVVASNDNARGHRANLLLVDEFVKVDADTIDTVFKKMLTSQREPKFLNKPEYKDYPREENMQMYLSSAWMKAHWSYQAMWNYTKQMLRDKAKDDLKSFVCHIPYFTGVKEKLYSHKQMKAEAQQDGFNKMKFAMEMEAKWWGESESAFFNFNKIDANRKLKQAFYPREVIEQVNFTNPEKSPKEKRILSVDVARMGGNSNDASVFSLIRLIPKNKQYERQLTYMQDMEGVDFQTQAIRIRQLFDDFDCDYIVLDLKNVGAGILDNLRIPLMDAERGIEYEPLNVCNNEDLASTCKFPDAPKVIHTISATNERNMEMANMLADNFLRGKFRLLIREEIAEELMRSSNKLKFAQLKNNIQAQLKYPFRQTELFINEVMNLEQVNMDGGAFKLVTTGTARKDRYSSVSYGNQLATELERDLQRSTKTSNFKMFGAIRKPKSII
ncbi:terminase large subunit domain-containing protein [Staphylococcus hyicus]|uniref:Terminase large subunit domain-containing protein n=1 Tax=Staphylococcus hyicus TaxID=1284 RepID=A0ACD5FNS2_STAHY|nr:terminase family protein [Staphylococcus hyicus]MDP4462644.1 terminase [Staphylococcus hyicus]